MEDLFWVMLTDKQYKMSVEKSILASMSKVVTDCRI